MNNRLNPELFARVLRLNDTARTELLELLGDTPIEESNLEELLTELEMRSRRSEAERGRRPS